MTLSTEYGEALETLVEAYGLGRMVGWVPLGGTRNRNFRVETASGTWLARKRYGAYASDEQIRFDHAVAAYLKAKGVATVCPRPLSTGMTFWKRGAEIWEVQPFVAGTQLREGHVKDIVALATALARFHESGETFLERYAKLGLRGETDPAQMRGKAGELEAASSECSRAVMQYLEWLDWAEALLPDDRFSALPCTLAHGDVQPANILVRDGCVAAFLDLDWCAWRPRIYDLGFALLFCCTTHDTPIDGGDICSLTQAPRVNPNTFRHFLDAYQKHTHPLTEDEREAMPAQIVLSWCHTRIMGAFKVPAPDRAAFLARPPYDRTELLPGGWSGRMGTDFTPDKSDRKD
ncbi:MAG: phosphotransferase [Candidatus Hydrogenedentes bacterium]|nr:phosphotransferase [Candidatus Hydrogenedentota bacterium]